MCILRKVIDFLSTFCIYLRLCGWPHHIPIYHNLLNIFLSFLFSSFHLFFPVVDKCLEWKNDSSGNEAAAGSTDPDGLNSDAQPYQSNITNSPPREKETINERRSKLFRSSTSAAPTGKKKQSLILTADQQTIALKSVLDSCLSPTNVEPRKLLLDQLTRTFSTEEAILPDIVSILGPPEPHGGLLMQSLSPLISAAFRPTFSPQNTAEVRAVLQALMNKIQK